MYGLNFPNSELKFLFFFLFYLYLFIRLQLTTDRNFFETCPPFVSDALNERKGDREKKRDDANTEDPIKLVVLIFFAPLGQLVVSGKSKKV